MVALGGAAFKTYLDLARRKGHKIGGAKFSHGASVRIEGMPMLYASYHPSPQNTNTGKLTTEMLEEVFEAAKADWQQ